MATVPASVTIRAGSTAATFTIATRPVIRTTSLSIAGTYAGGTKASQLNVTR